MAKSLLGQSNSQLMLSSKMERNENLSVVFDSISGEMLLEDVLVVFFSAILSRQFICISCCCFGSHFSRSMQQSETIWREAFESDGIEIDFTLLLIRS